MIGKIGPNNNIQRTSNTKKTQKNAPVKQNDKVEISSESMAKVEQNRLMDVIKQSPDIRADKVEQAKANLAKYTEGGSLDDGVANAIYDKIIDSLLG